MIINNCMNIFVSSKQLLFITILLFVISSSKMIIQSPSQLATYFKQKYPEGSIPYSIANYGDIPYGKTISGTIAIPSVLADCVYQEIQAISSRNIILVQRNQCTFTQKSINVEKQGGKLAIIMDNVVQNIEQRVLGDDGKGFSVKIPTIFINENDGQEIMKYIGKGVITSVTFDVKKSSQSKIQLWLDILNHKNFIFLRNFRPYFQKINSKVSLSVFYPTNRCPDNCPPQNCYFNGKYCKTPFNFMNVQNGGKQLINEQLRQQVIFQLDATKWWDYVDLFDQYCDNLAIYEQCSEEIANRLKLNFNQIKNKVNQTFEADDNYLLKQSSQIKYSNNILYYPSIIVNNVVYRGNLQVNDVFGLICQSMSPIPDQCSDQTQEEKSLMDWIIMGVILVLVFLVLMVVCFRRLARRQISSDMNKKVNELVNQYITFYESEKFKEGVELKPK